MSQTLIAMLIVCWVPAGNTLKEAWRIEKNVPLDHCLTMNRIAGGGGSAGAIVVRCGELPPAK